MGTTHAYAWYQHHPQCKDILDEHVGEGVSCQKIRAQIFPNMESLD